MKNDWLWDRKFSTGKVKKILSNPEHVRFISLVSTLLSRKNSPKEVFKEYISPKDFCRYWSRIKKQMRKDAWSGPRVNFWQAIYEKVKEKLKKKGIAIRPASALKPNKFLKSIGEQIKAIRLKRGMSQKDLAKALSISQQMISRIEKGNENISLVTLKNITNKLKSKVSLKLLDQSRI